MRVLHLIGRIVVLNRGNIASVRQIESTGSLSLAWPKYNWHIKRYDQTCPEVC